jgi:hypothetical protein
MTELSPQADDDTASARLISALRAEIEEVDRISDFDEEPELTELLPAEILNLVDATVIPTKVAAAVDEILADLQPLPNDFANRVRVAAATAVESLEPEKPFLEQLVVRSRATQGLGVDRVAEAVSLDVPMMEKVELGLVAFSDLGPEQVKDWIDFLDLDHEAAMSALERSVHAPALSYAGDPDEYSRRVNQFVESVRRLLSSD